MTTADIGRPYVCGLTNVFLVDHPGGTRMADPEFMSHKTLHRVIAEAIARRRGPLTGREIRFLRTELNLTPEELDDHIGFEADLIVVCESENWVLTRECDVKLRRLIFTHLKVKMPTTHEMNGLYCCGRPEAFVIRVAHGDPDRSWTLLAA
ncbi:MAG: hypothetical protein V4644_00395 [Patescibacteria group bacterium]